MRETILKYNGGDEFLFRIYEEDAGWMRGHFNTDAATQQRMRALVDEREEEVGLWYLDDEGNRLDDDALFAKTPWCVVAADGSRHPVVSRFQNVNTGEAWFCTEPWVTLSHV